MYQYKAISANGAEVTGVVEAYNQYEAVVKIKETCDVVLSIETVPIAGRKDPFAQKVKDKPLALMCSQFSIILGAGLPMVRAVELIAAQTDDATLKKILYDTAKDVTAGYSLAESLENKGPVLPVTFLETVRAGEESGTLEASFRKLYEYYDKATRLRGKVASAMVYPAFLAAAAVIVMIVILTVAVPMFSSMFASMGAELPLITRVLIGLSGFFRTFGILLLILLLALILGLRLYARTEEGRLAFARLRLQLPLLGRVARMQGASQFANTMATLLSAGLPMVRAVTITGRVLSNYLLAQAVDGTVPGLEEGRRLGDCLSRADCFPSMLVEMTRVGEETGSLETTLQVVGAFYDNEAEMATGRVLSLLEPVITVVMAGVVMLILLSLYLPMFSMYSSF